MRSLMLFGGGLDSIAYLNMLKHEKDDFDLLVINYGQTAFQAELESAKYWAAKYGVTCHDIDVNDSTEDNTFSWIRRSLSWDTSMLLTGDLSKPAFLAGRNQILCLLAVSYIRSLTKDDKDPAGLFGFHRLVLGLCDPGYEPFPDANRTFVKNLSDVFHASFGINVAAPYIRVDRVKMLKNAFQQDPEIFDKNATCWISNSLTGCGECKHCKLLADQRKDVLEDTESVTQEGIWLESKMTEPTTFRRK